MLVFPERPATGGRLATARRSSVPLLYVPAAAIAARRIVALTRGAASGELRLARHRSARPRAARLSLRLRRGGAGRPGPGVSRADVSDGAPPAAVDCVGHRPRRRPVRVRVRVALGARRESAVCAAVDGHPARFRPADLRVRDRPVSPARRGGDRQARSGLRGLPRRERRPVRGDAPARRVLLCRGSGSPQLGDRHPRHHRRRAAACSRSRRRCRTRWTGCSIATATTTGARSWVSRAI